MRRFVVPTVTMAAVILFLLGSALAQESSATIRTFGGAAYKVADPSLEVFYTIGDPKEKDEGDSQGFKSMSMINVSATAGAPSADQGGEKESKLLRGPSRLAEVTVSKAGVETSVPWDRIQSLSFARKPVAVAALPSYVPHYRHSVSVILVDGGRVDADYVNWGAAIVRGQTPAGRVDIPWEEVEQVIFER